MKRERGWNGAVVWRYALLQLPEVAIFIIVLWVVQKFVELPLWLSILILAGWVIKDVILFPFVWPSYDTRHADSQAQLVGKIGVVVRSPHPRGTMLYNGEFWQIRRENKTEKMPPGVRVRVTEQNGLILTVRLINEKISTTAESDDL